MRKTVNILAREYVMAYTLDLNGTLDYAYVISVGLFYKEDVKDSKARLILIPVRYADYQIARYPSGLYSAGVIESNDPELEHFNDLVAEFVFDRLTRKDNE